MEYIGIDIGSTAAKVWGFGDKELHFVQPTGWSSVDTSRDIARRLMEMGIDVHSDDVRVVATGYGRIAVEFADFVITEITCHGRGARELAGSDVGVIDVGGQDTKVILVEKNMVKDFLMNDKCSAGTGKFLEVMANRLGVDMPTLFELAKVGEEISISSLCTVFAESEIISYIGEGRSREDIAAGVVDSVANKVVTLTGRIDFPETVILTGGLSNVPYFAEVLSKKLDRHVINHEKGQFAGAIGAACLAKEKTQR